jgi:hypothetical protein
MHNTKYIGLDVHTESISAAVRDEAGKLVMDAALETKAGTILGFIEELRGALHVTFEEVTWAAWLYDLLRPHVACVVVCDPRRNALLKEGSKDNRVDARKLSALLRGGGLLRPGVPRPAEPISAEETGTKLSDRHGISGASEESNQGAVPRMGNSMQRPAGICVAPSRGMAGQD